MNSFYQEQGKIVFLLNLRPKANNNNTELPLMLDTGMLLLSQTLTPHTTGKTFAILSKSRRLTIRPTFSATLNQFRRMLHQEFLANWYEDI